MNMYAFAIDVFIYDSFFAGFMASLPALIVLFCFFEEGACMIYIYMTAKQLIIEHIRTVITTISSFID